MNFVGCIPRFLKAHAGWVLTALGSAGLIGTAVLAAKEAPEAKQRIEEAAEKAHEDWMCENVYPEESLDPEDYDIEFAENLEAAGEWPGLTFWQKTKIALPIYIPAILTGAGTLGCFWGAQIFNVRKQAALVAAYGALTMQFDQYREAIRAEHGEEADKKALEISKMEVKRLKGEVAKLKEENAPQLWEFAFLPGVIFEAKPDFMYKTFMLYNRNILHRGHAYKAELYKGVGIPSYCYNSYNALTYGWEEYENEVTWGSPYVDFRVRQMRARNGVLVNLVETFIPPFDIERDYGFEGDPTENIDPEYNVELAEQYIRDIEPNGVVKLTNPDMEIVYF